MPESEMDIGRLKRAVGFGREEAEHLRSLSDSMETVIPDITRRFYDALDRSEEALEVLDGSGVSREHLRTTLSQWMRELFTGRYGPKYCERRLNIGRAHVHAKLPQHLMFTSMSFVRENLTAHIRTLGLPDADAKITALHRLLDIELALMLESYHVAAEDRIRTAERNALQKRLDESEHLANVGQLAATLAHEIKNPLAGISGAIQVIGSSLPAGNPHKEVIEEILEEIDRLDATARDLLVYARPKPPRRKKVQVGQLMQQILVQLRNEPSVRGLPIHCDGLHCAAEAFIDEAQFRQVISNLLLNAAHACEKGGSVTFRLSSTDGMVCIDVIDTGAGIPAEEVAEVFEPFFTTKARGTGLGLSICKWIVESHGGTIQLSSKPGVGTSVTIKMSSRL